MVTEAAFPAKISETENIYDFISRTLIEKGLGIEIENLFKMAADEIFSNIVKHGFADAGQGAVVNISMLVEDDGASITFRDKGKPFDPLSLPSPDVSLDLNERPMGGLGVYIIRNSFDEAGYSFENGENIFTLKKLKKRRAALSRCEESTGPK